MQMPDEKRAMESGAAELVLYVVELFVINTEHKNAVRQNFWGAIGERRTGDGGESAVRNSSKVGLGGSAQAQHGGYQEAVT
jgi:hypothetical protein